jgi:hypothetical protein
LSVPGVSIVRDLEDTLGAFYLHEQAGNKVHGFSTDCCVAFPLRSADRCKRHLTLTDHPINRIAELLPWNIGLASPLRAAA